MPKQVTVFGADTAVGAAVAHHLSKKTKVKGVPLGHPKTGGEVDIPPGVEMVHCDPTNIRSLKTALDGSDGCFIFTLSDFKRGPKFMAAELEVGRNITDAVKHANIPHTIYCTEPHTTDIIGIGARHMVAKAETEECMTLTGTPITILYIPRLYEDIVNYLAPERVGNDFVFELPMDEATPLNMIGVEDIGPIVEKIFEDPAQFTNKKYTPGPISLCGSKISRQTFAQCLSYYLQPIKFFDKPLPHALYRDSNHKTPLPWREDYANMFLFLIRTGWDLSHKDTFTRNSNPNTLYFEEWVKTKAQALYTAYTEVPPESRLKWWFKGLYSTS